MLAATPAPSPSNSREQEVRINELITRLSLGEKIDLLGGHKFLWGTLANEKIGLPRLLMADGPTGIHWHEAGKDSPSTAYPATIGTTASWNAELVERLGRAIARDARARGIHVLLGPGVNHYRAALCGRNFEYMGEDPFLAARTVTAFIRGCQSEGVGATVKHFALNFQEYNRNDVSSDVDERTLHEIYLPPFKAAVTEANVSCVMTAYNLVNGVHCAEHQGLITEILKKKWGFNGLVLSDWVSTHSTVATANAGLDLEMPFALYFTRERLLQAIASGEVSEALIDDKVCRLLRLALRFGWLDGKPGKDTAIPLDNPASFAVALEVAREAFVLLKNKAGFLPLKPPQLKKLAVIGWHAHPGVIGGGGCSSFPANHRVSMLDGLRALLGDAVEIAHEAGPPSSRHHVFEQSRYRTPEGARGLRAEFFNNPQLEGEAVRVRTDQGVNHVFQNYRPVTEVTETHYSVRWTGFIDVAETGDHLFHFRSICPDAQVWIDDKPLFNLTGYDCKAITSVTRHLARGAHAVRMDWAKRNDWADVFFGWEPAHVPEDELQAAICAASGADAVLVFTGFDLHTERESADRSFALPPILERLVTGVADTNPNTAVVLHAGGGVDMAPWIDKIQALLHVWYPGQEGGLAAAEILLGRTNPSGKLPVTIEKRWEDNSAFSCYHDTDGDKRVKLSDGVFSGYRHFDAKGIEPLFPFGHGLSYTTFTYAELTLSGKTLRAGETLAVSVNVTNAGGHAGAEVVQLYIGAEMAPLPRPPQELKDYAKVFLQPGETRTVRLTLTEEALRYYDTALGDWRAAPGVFKIRIGASSRDIRLEGTFVYVAG